MRTRIALAALVIAAVSAPAAFASHSWNGYHWARKSNPFTLKLGDNVSGLWDSMLRTASSDWTKSTVLNTSVVTGSTTPKPCKAVLGRVEVCSASYGNTGWLGVASIWLQSGTKHIVQGTVKNNDFYFGSSSYRYNNKAEMQHVICQEVGHTLGLDHQSTSGASLNTCMDYYHNTSALDTKSTHPNSHDYQELSIIYSHLDSTTTVGALPARSHFVPLGQMGESTYVARLGNGRTRITYVRWATPIHASF